MSKSLPQIREKKISSISVAVPGLNTSTFKPGGGGLERSTLVISSGNPYPYKRGGTFYKTKHWLDLSEKTDKVKMRGPLISGLRWVCEGNVALGGPDASLSAPTAYPSVGELSSLSAPYGAVGWNRTRPTREVASAFVAAGELIKDGLPRLPGWTLAGALGRLPMYARAHAAGVQPRKVARGVGSEYLNYDFGWRPMVDDAVRLLAFHQNVTDRIRRWMKQGNGRVQRRRVVLKNETSVSSLESSVGIGSYLTGCGALGTWQGTRTQIDTESHRIWYQAGYRLNIPDLSVPRNMHYTRLALLGALPTVSAAWNLTPWSWLVGWFANYNSVFANVSDPLGHYFAASHAYVMYQRTTRRNIHVVARETTGNYGASIVVHVGGSRGTEIKFRQAASPFGFGFTWDTLNSSQLATAAALGISRV